MHVVNVKFYNAKSNFPSLTTVGSQSHVLSVCPLNIVCGE